MSNFLSTFNNRFSGVAVVDRKWESDEELRFWINCRPPLNKPEHTYTAQFLQDMEEFVGGLDLHNNERPEWDKITLLVDAGTNQKIRAMDMEDIGSARVRGEFALKHRDKVFPGEHFFDGIALVYGIYFQPRRLVPGLGSKSGAFYFGYTPPQDIDDYLNWLLRSSVGRRHGPQP